MGNFSQIGQSHLALKYVFIPVSATQLGVGYNPSGDAVQFAFMHLPRLRFRLPGT